jgi:hypothetical protein
MRESIDMASLVDIVIAITLIECCVLVAYRRSTGSGVALPDFVVNMVSGLCLMLALRCMAVDAGTALVAAFLVAAGVAHFTDIAMRWRRAKRGSPSSRKGAVA